MHKSLVGTKISYASVFLVEYVPDFRTSALRMLQPFNCMLHAEQVTQWLFLSASQPFRAVVAIFDPSDVLHNTSWEGHVSPGVMPLSLFCWWSRRGWMSIPQIFQHSNPATFGLFDGNLSGLTHPEAVSHLASPELSSFPDGWRISLECAFLPVLARPLRLCSTWSLLHNRSLRACRRSLVLIVLVGRDQAPDRPPHPASRHHWNPLQVLQVQGHGPGTQESWPPGKPRLVAQQAVVFPHCLLAL